jgi:DNA-binding response OmpR family regulator
MSKTLTLAGCVSITTVDGYAGWLLVKALIPSIVITDLDMPDWSGIELIAAMRHSTNPSIRAIPVIVCSATESASTIRAAFNAGGDRFLSKPIHMKMLCKMVYQLLNDHSHDHSPHDVPSFVPSEVHSNTDTITQTSCQQKSFYPSKFQKQQFDPGPCHE